MDNNLDIWIEVARKAYIASGVENQVDLSEVVPLFHRDQLHGHRGFYCHRSRKPASF